MSRSAWGGLHFMFLIFLAAGLIAALFKRAWLHVLACTGILPIAAVFLAPLVLAHTSNISFGAPFFGTIMGGTLIFLRIFVANTPRVGRARRTNRRAGAGVAERIASQSAARSKWRAGWPGGA